ncbi:MAG: type VI secretion system protein TssR domain-containing protein, partial [Chitinophagales bacterium]
MIILKKGLIPLNILFVSFLLLSMGLNAQPYKAVNFPSKYADPTGEADYAASSEVERSSRIWFVCSDRNNNPTYTKPGGTKSKHSIEFLDKFYVIGEDGEYLRLAKSTSGNISEDIEDVDGEIYINGEDYGWVHKSKTLLWRSCLLSKTKMATKAMLLNTVEGIDPDKISASDLEKVAFYKTPSLNRKSDNSASLFEFFFVYKRDGDAVLLGKNNYIADYYDDFEDVIMGWVPENKVIQWNHRVVAERNWESPAVKERIANDTKAAVFFRDFDAKAYKEKNNVSEQYVLWKEKVATKKRDPGQRKRFPILEEDEDGMMRVGAMGQVYNYDGSIDRQAYEDIIKEAGDLKLSKRNINVVFVTDGTKGMDTYVKKIGAVVKNTKSYFESNDDNTIRFGAVVYRDKEAGNLTELKKLTPNSDAIVNFFSNEVSTHYDDDDVGDAVNMGIYTAIQRLGLDKEETNLIVLVGGSPNHEREDDTQRTEEELIQLLHDYDCHLFAFLVNNESDDHEELIYQVRNMVLGIANKKYDKLKGDAKFQEMLKKNPQYLEKPRLVPYPRKQNMYRLERTATMGSIYHAEYGSTLALKDFEDELEKILKEADIQTHQFLNRVEFKVWGYGSNKGSVGMADAANFGPSF